MNIMVDGGIGPKNIDDVSSAGANMIVAGTSVFKAEDCVVAISSLKKYVISLYYLTFFMCNAMYYVLLY